jgi:superfamily II DNA or RNA helicase
MARIFRGLYHELSSSWDFRDSTNKIDVDALRYEIIRDEQGLYNITFYHISGNLPSIMFIYDLSGDVLKAHTADLSINIIRDYYYKYIHFAYHHVPSAVLKNTIVTVYKKSLCKHNEYMQALYQNTSYQIAGMYESRNNDTNRDTTGKATPTKLRIYFKNMDFDSFNILSNIYVAPTGTGKNLPENKKAEVPSTTQSIEDSIFAFLSTEEMLFFQMLFSEKKSFAVKSQYVSITKDSFVKIIPFIKNISTKFGIYETGEKLIFSETPFSINLFVSQIDDDNFVLRLSENQKIHQFFVNMSTYILIENVIHKVNLPFSDDIIKKIFEGRCIIKKSDLIYIKTIISKQLSLSNNYLDFEDNIPIPPIVSDFPQVSFHIEPLQRSFLKIQGFFSFPDGKNIPISVVLLGQSLIKYADPADKKKQTITTMPPQSSEHADISQPDSVDGSSSLAKEEVSDPSWYYLPHELIQDITKFITSELFFQTDASNTKEKYPSEWEVTKPAEVDHIKTNLYNKASPSWHLNIAKKLKPQFVQTIHLSPQITISGDNNIDWFAYNVIYKYHDIEITQDELRKHFASGKKYHITSDGMSVQIANREIFDEIETLISLGYKDADHFQKMAIYRLPWIYELKKLNPTIEIYGDEYLRQMYADLQRCALPYAQYPDYAINLVMRSYQKAGYQWIKLLEKYRLNGVLADDMGLGKTLQAISILADLPSDSISLILCPKTLLFNWGAEIEKFCPRLKYLIYEGAKEFRTHLLKSVPVQIVLCSYTLVQNDFDEFSKINFDYLILDEAQHIKNHRTLRSKAIKKLNSRHKLAMTGTPLENSVTELWSIFDFLMPGYLPSLKKFIEIQSRDVSMLENPIVESSHTYSDDEISLPHPDELATDMSTKMSLSAFIAPFILRRKKQDVLIELPDKQEQVIYVQMTPKQERYYLSVLDAIRDELPHVEKEQEGFVEDSTHSQFAASPAIKISPVVAPKVNTMKVLAALTRLRQICDHPALISDDWLKESDASGKLDTLKDLVADALASGRKILIFSQFVKMLRVIEKMVKKMNVQYEYMDGSTKDRKAAINHFNNNDLVRIFLISLKTGGFGINLTSADTVILVDPWWNPMVSNQAIDRAYRIGQTKKVLVYKLITLGSVEEKMLVLQKIKKDLFENVIDQGEAVLKKLSIEQIKNLFEYKV